MNDELTKVGVIIGRLRLVVVAALILVTGAYLAIRYYAIPKCPPAVASTLEADTRMFYVAYVAYSIVTWCAMNDLFVKHAREVRVSEPTLSTRPRVLKMPETG